MAALLRRGLGTKVRRAARSAIRENQPASADFHKMLFYNRKLAWMW
jgi:hypothetical protein